MPTRVILLRHAESADPTIFHGAESDVVLSPRGHRQAAALANVLAAHRPDVLISSAMRRALQTAWPISEACSLPLQVEPLLHERRVGALSGTLFQRKEGIWPDTLSRWVGGDTSYAPPGAESFDAIRDRVLPVWQRLTDAHAGCTSVIVAHGVICRVLILSVLPGLSAAAWHSFGPMANASINELVHNGQIWQAVQINQVPAAVQVV